MITTIHTEALRHFEVQQSELDYDKKNYEDAINRFGGREFLASVLLANSRPENAPLQVVPQNSEHDFSKQPQELQSYTATL